MDKLQLTGLAWAEFSIIDVGRASTQINECTSSKQPNLQLKTQPKLVLGSLPLAFALPALFLYWPVAEAQWWNINLINPRQRIRVLATAANTGREGMFKKLSSLYLLDIELRNQQKKLFLEQLSTFYGQAVSRLICQRAQLILVNSSSTIFL